MSFFNLLLHQRWLYLQLSLIQGVFQELASGPSGQIIATHRVVQVWAIIGLPCDKYKNWYRCWEVLITIWHYMTTKHMINRLISLNEVQASLGIAKLAWWVRDRTGCVPVMHNKTIMGDSLSLVCQLLPTSI